MKILMINKFLHPNGGAENYVFKLGKCLQAKGHEVQYFGMEHEGRIVGNCVNSYTSNMDFHGGSKLTKLLYPIRSIYSVEARRKIRMVLDDFQPDVCHLNNFNYQLTPSIILEIVKWRKQTNRSCRIVYTAHDYQLVCPNHMCHNPNTHINCEKCLYDSLVHCVSGKCIHGSIAKSIVGMAEAVFWKTTKVYQFIDTVICCSEFMKKKLDTNSILEKKTIVMLNFVDGIKYEVTKKKDYVLYFGRFAQEKGTETLLKVCKQLPDIPFVFAGTGPLERNVRGKNIQNVGFQTGETLSKLIKEARFVICPSEWYENCPFSVMESLMYATPVLGADIGGIPELIRQGENGFLFESGNEKDLKDKIAQMWTDRHRLCPEIAANVRFDDDVSYCTRLMKIYSE